MKRVIGAVRCFLNCFLQAEMELVSRQLKEQGPLPLANVPPLEELQRILADLQARHPYLKSVP